MIFEILLCNFAPDYRVSISIIYLRFHKSATEIAIKSSSQCVIAYYASGKYRWGIYHKRELRKC